MAPWPAGSTDVARRRSSPARLRAGGRRYVERRRGCGSTRACMRSATRARRPTRGALRPSWRAGRSAAQPSSRGQRPATAALFAAVRGHGATRIKPQPARHPPLAFGPRRGPLHRPRHPGDERRPYAGRPRRRPRERLAKAVHEAEVQRAFDLNAIERALARLPGAPAAPPLSRPGCLPARAALPAQRGGTQVQAALQGPLPSSRSRRLGGRLRSRRLLAGTRLAVEVDGAQSHHTRRAFHADRARDRRLAARIRGSSDSAGPGRRRGAGRSAAAIRAGGGPAAGSPPAPACA